VPVHSDAVRAQAFGRGPEFERHSR
jgi:hypothetical protein